MKRFIPEVIFFLITLMAIPVSAEELAFKYTAGEKYRVITEVSEAVSSNGVVSCKTDILYKVAISVLSAEAGKGDISASFQTSESFYSATASFSQKSNYRSRFKRDKQGRYTINKDYFMPVLRNLPFFPERTVKPGDTWTETAEEVHDLRRGYGIKKAFHFPVIVQYSYLRNEVKDGERVAVLKIHYTTFHRVKSIRQTSQPVPVKITGVSDQVYYWNIKEGKLHSYIDEFDYIFHLSNGKFVEYEGIARGRLIKSKKLNKVQVVKDLKAEIGIKGIADTTVKAGASGVTLTLDNIEFPPNKAALRTSEKKKLAKIAAIMKKYPGRDFLITGHTARVGPERTSLILSRKRARAVGNYLLSLGACKKNQVTTRGLGSQKPVASNANEKGRKKNRRVDITILEN
ncbi:MAG: OmpA family protein [bacterium]|nr:OmpA family protein [bacterium]